MSNFNILSIDFDFWYPGLGWQCTHCGRCKGLGEWKDLQRLLRGDIAFSRDLSITREGILIKISKTVNVYVSECHADIMGVIQRYQARGRRIHVCDIDYHIDNEHDGAPLHCGNWIVYAEDLDLIASFNQPKNKDSVRDIPTPHVVFICKSTPYLMVEGDKPFLVFLRQVEQRARKLIFWGYRRRQLRREYQRFQG